MDWASDATLATVAVARAGVAMERAGAGAGAGRGAGAVAVATGRPGRFYIIQLVPDIKPERVKLGYSDNIEKRLKTHRTTAPTAKLLKSYPCKRTWEPVVIGLVTHGCQDVGGEVFDCDSLCAIVERCNGVFRLMPTI